MAKSNEAAAQNAKVEEVVTPNAAEATPAPATQEAPKAVKTVILQDGTQHMDLSAPDDRIEAQVKAGNKNVVVVECTDVTNTKRYRLMATGSSAKAFEGKKLGFFRGNAKGAKIATGTVVAHLPASQLAKKAEELSKLAGGKAKLPFYGFVTPEAK